MDVSALESELWNGYSSIAAPALETISRKASSVELREKALLVLAEWYFCNEDFLRCKDQLLALKEIKPLVTYQAAITLIRCDLRLGNVRAAIAGIADLRKNFGETNEVSLLVAETLRQECDQRSLEDQCVASLRQLKEINRVFDKRRLAKLTLKDPTAPLSFSNLSTQSTRPVNSDIKISVLMPTFNGADTIAVALQSIQRQSWQNLEVIVIDDCSTDHTYDVVSELAAQDKRIKYLRMPKNSGAYPARNVGLAHATGEFVTVHDSDDWSHPQKIERQFATLAEHPTAIGTVSFWLRVRENFELVGPWNPSNDLTSINVSSLILPRKLVQDFGGWDPVRISADSELSYRAQAKLGKSAIVRGRRDDLLSFSLSREDSLTQTRSTHLSTLRFGVRWMYRDSYSHWHKSEAFRADSKHQPERRQFTAPRASFFAPANPVEYDTVLIADWAMRDNMQPLLDLLSGLRGSRRAILHWRAYGRNPETPLNPAMYAYALKNNIDLLTSETNVTAREIVIADPRLLDYTPDELPRIKAENVVVLASKNASGQPLFDVRHLNEKIRNHFGVDARFV